MLCPRTVCFNTCLDGFLADDSGCPTCKCVDPCQSVVCVPGTHCVIERRRCEGFDTNCVSAKAMCHADDSSPHTMNGMWYSLIYMILLLWLQVCRTPTPVRYSVFFYCMRFQVEVIAIVMLLITWCCLSSVQSYLSLTLTIELQMSVQKHLMKCQKMWLLTYGGLRAWAHSLSVMRVVQWHSHVMHMECRSQQSFGTKTGNFLS